MSPARSFRHWLRSRRKLIRENEELRATLEIADGGLKEIFGLCSMKDTLPKDNKETLICIIALETLTKMSDDFVR